MENDIITHAPHVHTSHLLIDGQIPEYVELADLIIRIGSLAFPCHSSILAKESKVLCRMFASTLKESWEVGVTAAVQGHLQTNVQLLLALCHSTNSIRAVRSKLGLKMVKDWAEIEDLLELVHKLDVPRIFNVNYFIIFSILQLNISNYMQNVLS